MAGSSTNSGSSIASSFPAESILGVSTFEPLKTLETLAVISSLYLTTPKVAEA